MTTPYDYDQTNIDHLRAVIDEQEQTIEYLHERCKAEEVENAKLQELCVKALEWLRWAGGITCPPEVPDEFADELRELGVEVDR